MGEEIMLDDKNVIVMKLLHYFITEKNYNPIILQGVDNEIWLENLNSDCEIVRIVSENIYNNEQYDFDVFKTKRILKKIKKKTLTFNINVFSIFLNMSDNVTEKLDSNSKLLGVKVSDENDLKKNKKVKEMFPDLAKKMKYSEEGVELFMKITSDINKHNKEDAKRLDRVFKSKTPYITYLLIIINCIFYFLPNIMGKDVYQYVINSFCIHGPSIRAGQYYRLITGMFLHGSIIHLFLNCYSLYIVGSQIESFFGKIKYLIIYLFSGLTGSLLSITLSGSTASIGASGAIFGLMGALLYFGFYYRVYLGNAVKTQIIPIIILNLFIGFTIPGIDNWGHIGGLIGGVLSSMALGVKDKSTKFEEINGWIICLLFLVFLLYMGLIFAGR